MLDEVISILVLRGTVLLKGRPQPFNCNTHLTWPLQNNNPLCKPPWASPILQRKIVYLQYFEPYISNIFSIPEVINFMRGIKLPARF